MRAYSLMTKSISAAALATLGCCGATIQASDAYDAAHDIETKAGLAQADLVTCKADNTKCDAVDKDLKDIVETSKALQSKSAAAGYNPNATPATK